MASKRCVDIPRPCRPAASLGTGNAHKWKTADAGDKRLAATPATSRSSLWLITTGRLDWSTDRHRTEPTSAWCTLKPRSRSGAAHQLRRSAADDAFSMCRLFQVDDTVRASVFASCHLNRAETMAPGRAGLSHRPAFVTRRRGRELELPPSQALCLPPRNRVGCRAGDRVMQ